MNTIYLDHAATTPMAPEVMKRFCGLLEEGIANSSSGHREGTHALALLNQARETVSKKLGCASSEIVFTSGGTEGNNWILQRVIQDAAIAMTAKNQKPHFITSPIEHSSIANVAEWLKKTEVAEWSEVPVDAEGRVSPKTLASLIKPTTVLVSILHGNNEIGTIQDLKALGEVCRDRNVLFHSDACQTFCHEPFSVAELPVDFMTLSGHKIRAPKGVGAVFIRRGIELTPLLFGGKQEKGLRPGTTSVELIAAFAKATEVWGPSEIAKIKSVRRYAIDALKKNFPSVRFNGDSSDSGLCHVLSFTPTEVHSKELHRALAASGVACSTGAACGTGKSDSSAVLLALGRPPETAHQIRLSFSPTTENTTIDAFIAQLTKVMKELKI